MRKVDIKIQLQSLPVSSCSFYLAVYPSTFMGSFFFFYCFHVQFYFKCFAKQLAKLSFSCWIVARFANVLFCCRGTERKEKECYWEEWNQNLGLAHSRSHHVFPRDLMPCWMRLPTETTERPVLQLFCCCCCRCCTSALWTTLQYPIPYLSPSLSVWPVQFDFPKTAVVFHVIYIRFCLCLFCSDAFLIICGKAVFSLSFFLCFRCFFLLTNFRWKLR